jgi:hypothetical protein
MEHKLFSAKTIRITARLLSGFYAGLLSIFSLDVFSEGLGFWKTLVALCMHLIPVWMVLLILWISWKHSRVGGIVYPLLGILYIGLAWGRFPLTAYLFIAGPLFLLGALYLADDYHRRKQSSPNADMH